MCFSSSSAVRSVTGRSGTCGRRKTHMLGEHCCDHQVCENLVLGARANSHLFKKTFSVRNGRFLLFACARVFGCNWRSLRLGVPFFSDWVENFLFATDSFGVASEQRNVVPTFIRRCHCLRFPGWGFFRMLKVRDVLLSQLNFFARVARGLGQVSDVQGGGGGGGCR